MNAFDNFAAHRFGLPWQLAVVLVFNSLIAVLLAAMTDYGHVTAQLPMMFAYSQAIGLSIFTSIHALAALAGRAREPAARDAVIGVVAGSLAGSLIGGAASGTLELLFAAGWVGFGTNLLAGALFSLGVGYLIETTRTRFALKEQELARVAAEKELAVTRLRLLQAQIEPHFLFNTLSNIHSLIAAEPAGAARMLELLTRYLRATLARSRSGEATLGDELALLRTYLDIQQVRMGERLRARFDVPAELHGWPFPSLLLQPLVENAVRHGLEPAPAGGSVEVRARRSDGRVRIEVEDDGAGFGNATGGSGVGLANVQARLTALYGDSASLRVYERAGGGVCAALDLPFAESSA